MTLASLALLLTAAVLHATWNYWAKRAGGGLPFVYLVSLLINLGYVPVVTLWLLLRPTHLPPMAFAVIIVSGGLKTAYSLYLQRGYRNGDFSIVYPVARGTGPLLSALGAIVLLRERPSLLALAGILLIVSALFIITGAGLLGRAFRQTADRELQSLRYGLFSGVAIASYTLWDKQGMSAWLIAPVLYDAGTAATQCLLLTPFAWRRRAEVAFEWHEHRMHAFIVALISPLAYILVLTALRYTPVTYVAPVREVSIVFGAFFGAKFLGETNSRRRLWAAALMFAGIVALSMPS